ncbi:MAG TPA: RluA family pseudouridine synthase [Desulfocapsa sulfexigens]|nr:RluA family pseudouridine synthase [Desulfocapsa sulfexigens]
MEFIIDTNFHDVRLDKFLRKTYQNIPVSGIFKMIRKGNVKVNKKKKKQNYRLQAGDVVRVWEASAPTAAEPLPQLSANEKEFIQSCIVFENNDLILCNKPPGMVMHAGSSHEQGLSELVKAYTENRAFSFVHRIDKMTSGLVLGAKNLSTARKLSDLIHKRKIKKIYIVLVEGKVEKNHFKLENFLKKELTRVVVHPDNQNGAKEACSEFTILKRGRQRTLLKAELHTGRTHQLRVQLAHVNHPIVGDQKYGKKQHQKRMYLLSQRLIIPALNFDFTLPVPESFYAAL